MKRDLRIVSSQLREPPALPAPAAPVAQVAEVAHQLEPPVDFDDIHREEWNRICTNAPHLVEGDRNVLEILVSAVILHREAAMNVRKIGPLIKSSKGVPMQNPYLPVKNAQAKLIARYSDALGLSPVSRIRGKFKGKTAKKSFSAFAHLKGPGAF